MPKKPYQEDDNVEYPARITSKPR